MDFSYTEEQQEIADLARQILADGATHQRMKALEKDSGRRFDEELWREIARAGMLGIAIPEEFGGAGLGFLELAAVVEQVGRTTAPIPFIETAVLGALPIVEFGSAEQKKDFLPRVVAGDVVLTAALVEAEGDPARPSTTASGDGDG